MAETVFKPFFCCILENGTSGKPGKLCVYLDLLVIII